MSALLSTQGRRELARAISAIEDRTLEADALLESAAGAERVAQVIGITGPPGAGKSTLVDRLAVHVARQGEHVAVLAVDPSSPFSGGAVLGDRIRMDRIADDSGIYLRSLSARGEPGGLNEAASDIVTLLNAAGFTRIILETVGAGQSDIEIMSVADAVIVVLAPGLGDHVQAAKAGIMEIGDIFAINKFDLPGAEATLAQIELAVHISSGMTGAVCPTPLVRSVSALSGDGVDALSSAIDAYVTSADSSGRRAQRRRRRIETQLRRLLSARLLDAYLQSHEAEFCAGLDRVCQGLTSPKRFVDLLVATRR